MQYNLACECMLNKWQVFISNQGLNEYVNPPHSQLSFFALFAEHGNPIDEKLAPKVQISKIKIHTMTLARKSFSTVTASSSSLASSSLLILLSQGDCQLRTCQSTHVWFLRFLFPSVFSRFSSALRTNCIFRFKFTSISKSVFSFPTFVVDGAGCTGGKVAMEITCLRTGRSSLNFSARLWTWLANCFAV